MNLDATIKELRELKRLREDLDLEIAQLEVTIKEYMQAQGKYELKGPDYSVSWLPRTSVRVDTTKLKKELPEVAAKYSKNSTSRWFVIR